MKNELSLAYERLNEQEKKPVDYDGQERALSSFSLFKGKCNKCVKICHRGANCCYRESQEEGQNHNHREQNGSTGGQFRNRNENGDSQDNAIIARSLVIK
jgi:hypothetical protein